MNTPQHMCPLHLTHACSVPGAQCSWIVLSNRLPSGHGRKDSNGYTTSCIWYCGHRLSQTGWIKINKINPIKQVSLCHFILCEILQHLYSTQVFHKANVSYFRCVTANLIRIFNLNTIMNTINQTLIVVLIK